MFRYDEYGEGRGSASNSDQTGTMSRASYHSSDPDHYPDLLDIPNRSDGRVTALKFKFLILFRNVKLSSNFQPTTIQSILLRVK